MEAPNIESIATSMRDCSLNSGRGIAPPHQPVAAETQEQEVTVELNSDTAFPIHMKQCLDIKTGKKFYVNCKNSERRTEVLRIANSGLQVRYHSSEDYNSDDAGDIEDEEGNDGDVEDCSSLADGGTDYEDYFGINSKNTCNSSSADSDASGENGGAGDLILVVVGCKSCFMYFMVPKRVEACPRCGGCLLHFV